MRKILLCVAMITLLLCGCQNSENTNDYIRNISKTQAISVVSSDSSSEMETITDNSDIEKFVSEMNLEEWTAGNLPKDAKEIGSFLLSQEKTVKLGELEADGKLYDVGKIIIYDSSYVNFEILGVSITFKVPDDTADYLREYF